MPTGDDVGVLELIDAIRSGVRRWIDLREPNRLAYMESQYALARVAAGLNLANKRVPGTCGCSRSSTRPRT